MPQNHFNNDHFKLLYKWKGTTYDKSNPEQQRVYKVLEEAYDVTKHWAEALQQQLFQDGRTKTVRKPIDQWQKKFTPYHWARIYPTQNAPDGLAYTVGIDAELGFVVKIDLVDIKVNDSTLRKKYEQIRGSLTSSPIVAIKSADKGLALDFTALVDWSADAITKFKPTYDELVEQLGLSAGLDHAIEDEPKNDKAPRNFIYYGPPGTGKTFDLQAVLGSDYTDAEYGERYEFVTFHQSYGYEEFVEGLRPIITKRDEKHVPDSDTAAGSNGEVRYEIKPGAFLRLCDRARKNPSRQYAMVIDEINRGNISKIFGELITLVEVDKREGARYPVAVSLPYSAARFSVPWNVDVIGTMNTADRSLALVDTALRRRFEFIESMPKPSVLAGTLVSHDGVDINIEQMLTMLNKRIEALYDRDHTVGHAYFTCIMELKNADRFNELKTVFRNKIIPLLEEYFFEDWQKIRMVLGDNQKPEQEHQFVHEIGREEDLLALFGRDHELDQYAIRSRYQLNAAALDLPDSYVGIYAAKPAVTGG